MNITLRPVDIDTEFLSVFITELPVHGNLYYSGSDQMITKAYSAWDVVQPISQFVSSVRGVSTFWPAGDDGGNGFPSWHPFRE